MHFYQFNIGDYAKKTQHLTNEEDLAYRRLLDYYYDTENPRLTDGLATLSRRLRISEETLKIVLEEFFVGGKNPRADEEIEKYHAFIEKQKSNGIKGGRPKHKPTANPPLTHWIPTVNPSPSQPITNNQVNINSTTLSGKPDLDDELLKLNMQPKKKLSEACAEVLQFLNDKVGRNYRPVKANIELIAARLKDGATVDECRQVIAKKCREWKGTEMDYCLRPATLFNRTKFAQYQGELVL